jgi:hypothetical protein
MRQGEVGEKQPCPPNYLHFFSRMRPASCLPPSEDVAHFRSLLWAMLHTGIFDYYPIYQPCCDQLIQVLSGQLNTRIHAFSALSDSDEFTWFHDPQEGLYSGGLQSITSSAQGQAFCFHFAAHSPHPRQSSYVQSTIDVIVSSRIHRQEIRVMLSPPSLSPGSFLAWA